MTQSFFEKERGECIDISEIPGTFQPRNTSHLTMDMNTQASAPCTVPRQAAPHNATALIDEGAERAVADDAELQRRFLGVVESMTLLPVPCEYETPAALYHVFSECYPRLSMSLLRGMFLQRED